MMLDAPECVESALSGFYVLVRTTEDPLLLTWYFEPEIFRKILRQKVSIETGIQERPWEAQTLSLL